MQIGSRRLGLPLSVLNQLISLFMKTSPSLFKANDPPVVFTFQQSMRRDQLGYPICARREVNQVPTRRHEHVYHEIVLVESGSATHSAADGTRRLRAGDVLIIKPHIWHQYSETSNFCIINCIFDRRVLMDQSVFLNLMGDAFELFRRPPRDPQKTAPTFLHVSPSHQHRLRNILEAIIRERRDKLMDWEGALLVHLLDLILALARIKHGGVATSSSPLTPGVRDFVNEVVVWLEGNYAEKIALPELARRWHVSTSYLSRVFARRMGMGIVDFVHHLRIEAAAELLREADWPISRIAGEVGYDEITYFSRRFKRQTGTTPQQYRRLSQSV